MVVYRSLEQGVSTAKFIEKPARAPGFVVMEVFDKSEVSAVRLRLGCATLKLLLVISW